MTIPITPTWASEAIVATDTIAGTLITYHNKLQPPSEMQTAGLLAGTPCHMQHLNYQFNKINENLDYLKEISTVRIGINASTSRVYSPEDAGMYIQFINTGASTYTFNGGVAATGDKVEIRQYDTGVVTLTAGTGTVTFKYKTGFLPKTSGIHTTIWAIKVFGEGTTERWDIGGELGT